MLVPESGRVRCCTLSRGRLAGMVAAALFVAFAAGGLAGWKAAGAPALWDLVRQARALAAARAEAEQRAARLEKALEAERAKRAVLAEEIGAMQARLARLGTVGRRLAVTARLDPKTFDLTVAPAFGGPARPAAGPQAPSLDAWMDTLAARARSLDAELAVLDAMLMQQQSQQEARPHLWPTEGGWISSGFGVRVDPFTGRPAMHRGVDIADRPGAPVYAASRGVVVFAGPMKDFGRMVEIAHGYGYRTRYGHLSRVLVRPGDVVEVGQIIGRIGSTGRSTGPHLHYEVHRYGKALDPRPFLPASRDS